MQNSIDSYIPYNKPFISGEEEQYIQEVIKENKFSGKGYFTTTCHEFFKHNFNFNNCFLTHSCSSALEMAAILCDFKKGDEVILPSFAYVTTASTFHDKGASLVFVDSQNDQPNICPKSIRQSITKNTKAIVIVHYAGNSCNMEAILEIVKEFNLILIEDCAHAIDAKYNEQFLGTFGHISTFSFHETKNIQSGEGGLLVVNDEDLVRKATMIWHEGTNRDDFDKGLVNKFEWSSRGSSYQPSEVTAAFLYSQLKYLPKVTSNRIRQWNYYLSELSELVDDGFLETPKKVYGGHNAHIFYVRILIPELRDQLMSFLKEYNITSVFHYLPLHSSTYWLQNNEKKELVNAENWSHQILRLPLYDGLKESEQDYIITVIFKFFRLLGRD